MAKARTWIIGILVFLGVCVVGLLVFAGLTTMWVMRHISTAPASATSAVKTFDEERARFGTQTPLLKLDDLDRLDRMDRMERAAELNKRLSALPPAAAPATDLAILVWDPTDERTVRISLPFWLLKLGKRKIDIGNSSGFDFERLNIDVEQLEKIGPRLLVDLQRPGGERVLVWTR
jgi:hypothetical protein